MSAPLGIIELLSRIGEDRVQLQNLQDSFIGAQQRKRGITEIRFGTQAITATEIMLGTNQRVGMILWLPKDDIARILADHKDGHLPAMPEADVLARQRARLLAALKLAEPFIDTVTSAIAEACGGR